MMKKALWLPLSLVLALPFGCSSAESPTPGGSGGAAPGERRTPIGKADLAGSCKDNAGTTYCGGKTKEGNCWCDAGCQNYGDCCSDVKTVCGDGGNSCESTKDCDPGFYCKSEDGCNTPGTCTKIPAGTVCPAVVMTYCGCDGKTKHSSSGCIWDRVKHTGACTTDKKVCGGIANLPCPADMHCVDDPDDSCDPNNGGADCSGVCVPTNLHCPPVVCQLFCENGFETNDKGCPICKCKEAPPKNTCDGACGGKSADGSCYCDTKCKQLGDCCSDYDAKCGVREPASGTCVKNSGDSCSTDADCIAGGCGGELCYNPTSGGGFSTCECAGPGGNAVGCGCVQGKCSWYK